MDYIDIAISCYCRNEYISRSLKIYSNQVQVRFCVIITVSNKQPMGCDTQLAFLWVIFHWEMSSGSFVQLILGFIKLLTREMSGIARIFSGGCTFSGPFFSRRTRHP